MLNRFATNLNCSFKELLIGPVLVAQVTQTQCAPTGAVYRRSRGSTCNL